MAVKIRVWIMYVKKWSTSTQSNAINRESVWVDESSILKSGKEPSRACRFQKRSISHGLSIIWNRSSAYGRGLRHQSRISTATGATAIHGRNRHTGSFQLTLVRDESTRSHTFYRASLTTISSIYSNWHPRRDER